MDHVKLSHPVSLSDEDRLVLRTVAETMGMGAATLLTAEVQATSIEDARAYLKGFVAHAEAAQLRTIYCLTRILTEKSQR